MDEVPVNGTPSWPKISSGSAIGPGCKPEALNSYGGFWFHSPSRVPGIAWRARQWQIRPFPLYAICPEPIGYKLLKFYRKKWSADAERESKVKQTLGGEVRPDDAPSGLQWHLTCHAADALKREVRRFTRCRT
jgi:hypothetical protein